MHFTIIFKSHQSYDLSYGLVFISCPVFIEGKREIINLNYETPEYKLGSIKKLIDLEDISKIISEGKECVIVVHPEGNGTDEDLKMLERDLKREGFKFGSVWFNEKPNSGDLK